MSTTRRPNYIQKWINKSDHIFKLLMAEVMPKGDVPAPNLELHPGKEKTLEWPSAYLEENATTGGYLRWLSIPAGQRPGSGTAFGVKIAQKFVRGLWEPAQILTYNGSPSGSPNAWFDITPELRDSEYSFTVRGEPGEYRVTIQRLPKEGDHGARDSLIITVQNLLLEDKPDPERSNYSETWSNQSDRAFELNEARVYIDPRPYEVQEQKPPPHFILDPGKETKLSWACPVLSDLDTTFGYLRFLSEKAVPGQDGSGHEFAVMIQQDFFGVLGSNKLDGIPKPPKIKTYSASPTHAAGWDDVTEKFHDEKYTFSVNHKPHNYLVIIQRLKDIHVSRCSLLVTIKNA